MALAPTSYHYVRVISLNGAKRANQKGLVLYRVKMAFFFFFKLLLSDISPIEKTLSLLLTFKLNDNK